MRPGPHSATILEVAELPMPAKPFLPRVRPPLPTPAVLALLLTGLAAGCGPKDTEFPPACPSLALLPDAGDLARFNGQGQDIVNLITRARITGVPAKCETGDKKTVLATLHIEANISRGPASPPTPAPIDYFIALMEGDKVLQEQDFVLTPTFAPNVDRASVRGDDIQLTLPISKTKSAAVYRIFVGFRLSRDELAYNRAHPQL
jgi:hypothetical protein